ncbi:EC protein III-like [Populus trichocarpa]|nr:EC protein III-like [Populus trichocarpa]
MMWQGMHGLLKPHHSFNSHVHSQHYLLRERAKERRIMADTRGGTVGFNDGDGCPVPCPGGTARRCGSVKDTSGEGEGAGHKKCSCGEHYCGCNPCTCPRSVVTTGVGKAYCTCGAGCACPTCSS